MRSDIAGFYAVWSVSADRLFLARGSLLDLLALLGGLGALGERFLLLAPALLPQLLCNRLAEIRRALHRPHAGALQRFELVRGSALAAGPHRARVTPPLP